MYPTEELTRLATKKEALRLQIYLRREECAAAAERAAKTLEMVARGLAWWHKLSPVVKLAAVPVGLIIKRSLFRRSRVIGTALRWGPIAFGAIRGFLASRRSAQRS